jgi:hypothetical protein
MMGSADATVSRAKAEAVECAKRIVAGNISPYEGAREMWLSIWPLFGGNKAGDVLGAFLGEVEEWESHPVSRSEIERAIIVKAETVVKEWGHGN